MKYNYGEMIHRYLDGMLPEDLEHQLFDELARNPELRRSFGLELDIQKAATTDSTALITPDNVRVGVFSALEIPLAADATVIAPAAPQLLTFTSIALVSMLFGGVIVWLGMQGQNSSSLQIAGSTLTSPQILSSLGPEQSFITKMNAIPMMTSLGREQSFITRMNAVLTPEADSRQPLQTLLPTSSATQPHTIEDNSNRIHTSEDQILTSEYYLASPVVSFGASNTMNYLNQNNRDRYVAGSLPLPQFIDIPQDIPMSVSVRGMQEISGANGIALTALYPLDDEQALGVEVSTTRITRYEQRKTGGLERNIALSEPSTMIGCVYRISLPGISIGEFSPYLQSFAGATTKGLPVGRTTLGLQWTPDRRVTLSGGLDGTLYGYETNGQWKAGVMTSLVYGVSVIL